jgi:hypothetical protein
MITNLEIRWPRGEPEWIDFQEDFVLFGDVEFIKHWDDADSRLRDSSIRDAFNQQWHRLIPNHAGWLFGDMPGLLAPSNASDSTGKSVLAIWELISAQDGFVMPDELVPSSIVMDEPIHSAILETARREFRIFASCEPGESVMARQDFPVFYFGDNDSKLDVIPAHVTVDGRRGEFLIHLVSGGFDHCVWNA